MSRSMSWVVTGAPFSMLAELPMTTASSLTARSALASATSVFSEVSEDVAPILPARDEHGPTPRREEEAAHDHPQVAGIYRWKLGRQPPAHVSYLAGEPVDVARPPSARAIPARRRALRRAPAPPSSATHLPGIHGFMVTQALGFSNNEHAQ